MRKVTLIGFVLLASFFSACQPEGNTFVVINESGKTVEVTYRVKSSKSPQLPHIAPSTLPVSQLDANIAWQPLPESRFKISPADRIISLTLNAGEAYRLEQCHPARHGSTGACSPKDFSIDSISIVGTKGDVYLTGEQTQSGFVPTEAKKNRYVLTYK